MHASFINLRTSAHLLLRCLRNCLEKKFDWKDRIPNVYYANALPFYSQSGSGKEKKGLTYPACATFSKATPPISAVYSAVYLLQFTFEWMDMMDYGDSVFKAFPALCINANTYKFSATKKNMPEDKVNQLNVKANCWGIAIDIMNRVIDFTRLIIARHSHILRQDNLRSSFVLFYHHFPNESVSSQFKCVPGTVADYDEEEGEETPTTPIDLKSFFTNMPDDVKAKLNASF